MALELQQIPVWRDVDSELFHTQIVPLNRPAVLKQVVPDWPAIHKAGQSPAALCDYLLGFDSGAPFQAFFGPPEIEGRFCYSDDLRGFNYEEKQVDLRKIADLLLQHIDDRNSQSFYAGSLTAERHLPGFAKDNFIDFVSESADQRIWIGNRTRVAPHYDIPSNIACVVCGRRRFTVFPIEQVRNLYVGPLDFTPAGQSLSLVDFHNPDFERYPRYRAALAAAQTAELEPGDGIYIPSLWWHQVEALGNFNVLVNFWWRDAPGYLDSPFNSLLHCLLSIRDLPAPEREAWKELFDFYIFQTEGDPMAHLPMEDRGIFAEMTPENARQLRAYLINALNR